MASNDIHVYKPIPIPIPIVETRHALSLHGYGYKSAVTKHAHQSGFAFDWQLSFHDHIIRDDQEYQRINDYIENNPQQWHGDCFFTPPKH